MPGPVVPTAIGITVSDDAGCAYFCSVVYARSARRHRYHRSTDFRCLYCCSNRPEKPVHQVLSEVCFFFGRTNIVWPVGNDAKVRSVSKAKQRLFGAYLLTHPHHTGLLRNIAGTDEVERQVTLVIDASPFPHKLHRKIDMNPAIGLLVNTDRAGANRPVHLYRLLKFDLGYPRNQGNPCAVSSALFPRQYPLRFVQ